MNNFRVGFFQTYNYYNFSERVDYNINDNWRVFGRIGRYHTEDLQDDPTPNNSQLFVPTGTLQRGDADLGRCGVDGDSDHDRQFSRRLAQGRRRVRIGEPAGRRMGEHMARQQLVPEPSRRLRPECLCTSRTWTSAAAHIGGGGFYWNQAPKGESINAKISQQRGSHYLKAGLEYRRSYGLSFVSNTSRFNFPASLTANTPVNPNTLDTGSAVASFLLGAMNPDATQMIGGPAPDPHIKYWGMFIQDDWKISRNITLNLGLRNEYETGFYDPQRFFARGLDLTAPVPEMKANPPQMPAQALALVGSNYFKWNGLYQWTGDGNPSGMWDPQKFTLQPRAGIAIRISDQDGVPRRLCAIRHSDGVGRHHSADLRFRDGRIPVAAVLRRYRLPESGSADSREFRSEVCRSIPGKQQPPASDRRQSRRHERRPRSDIRNVLVSNEPEAAVERSAQLQLPAPVSGPVRRFRYLLHEFRRPALYSSAERDRSADPPGTQQNALNQPVDNPFFNYLTPQLFPGQLRNQRQVSLGSLIKPYPHYGPLYEIGIIGAGERYHSLELKAQKMYSQGFNFLFAYVYIREKLQINSFNDVDIFANTSAGRTATSPAIGLRPPAHGICRSARAALIGRRIEGGGCGDRRLEVGGRLDLLNRRVRPVRQPDCERESRVSTIRLRSAGLTPARFRDCPPIRMCCGPTRCNTTA